MQRVSWAEYSWSRVVEMEQAPRSQWNYYRDWGSWLLLSVYNRQISVPFLLILTLSFPHFTVIPEFSCLALTNPQLHWMLPFTWLSIIPMYIKNISSWFYCLFKLFLFFVKNRFFFIQYILIVVASSSTSPRSSLPPYPLKSISFLALSH